MIAESSFPVPNVDTSSVDADVTKVGEQPLVSIVIPTLNRKELIVQTLKSLSKTIDQNIEILVIDDGSSDGSQDLDVQAIDPRIRLICHPTNRGGSAARNTGIDAARAPLVAFLDSDDDWLPGKLERQLALASREQPGCNFIATGNVEISLAGVVSLHNSRRPRADEDISEYLMIEKQAIQTSTMLLPTKLARRIRFRDGLRRHQDWDFLLRALQSGARLLYDDQPLATYNLAPDPGRVSIQRNRLGATLEWYRLAYPLLSARSMRHYFVRSMLGRDGLREIGTSIRGLGWLATRSVMAPPLVLATLITEAAAKLRTRFRH
jgi:glycosyltransferase involved in cell wall biosynthesis